MLFLSTSGVAVTTECLAKVFCAKCAFIGFSVGSFSFFVVSCVGRQCTMMLGTGLSL